MLIFTHLATLLASTGDKDKLVEIGTRFSNMLNELVETANLSANRLKDFFTQAAIILTGEKEQNALKEVSQVLKEHATFTMEGMRTKFIESDSMVQEFLTKILPSILLQEAKQREENLLKEKERFREFGRQCKGIKVEKNLVVDVVNEVFDSHGIYYEERRELLKFSALADAELQFFMKKYEMSMDIAVSCSDDSFDVILGALDENKEIKKDSPVFILRKASSAMDSFQVLTPLAITLWVVTFINIIGAGVYLYVTAEKPKFSERDMDEQPEEYTPVYRDRLSHGYQQQYLHEPRSNYGNRYLY